MSESESNDLCAECGLCCSGYLYTVVRLEPGEVEPATQAGITCASDETGAYMTLPCACHAEQRCTIYEARPQSCRVYECATLWQLNRGEIDRDEASSRVREALEWKQAVANAARGEAILDIRIRRAVMGNEGKVLDPNTLLHRLNALDEVLDRWFRKPGQAHLPVYAELEGRSVSPPSESDPPAP